MTTFETLATHEHAYGNGNFIEVARKIARDGRRKDGVGTEFVMISRGYQTREGERRYRAHVTVPYEPEVVEFVRTALTELGEPIATDLKK